MAKKLKPAEYDEADRIESAIVLLGASDFKPRSNQYAIPPAAEHTEWLLGELNRQNTVPQGTEGMIVLPRGPAAIALPGIVSLPGVMFSELERLDATRIQSLKLMNLIPSTATEAVRLRSARVENNGKCRETVYTLTDAKPSSTSPKTCEDGQSWFLPRPFGTPGLNSNRDYDVQRHPPIVGFAWRAIHENWSVLFAMEKAPAVRLLACADSVAGLFRLRDKESGLSRRQALRHWVRDHKRKKPDGIPIDIAGHLRGATSFNWFGMTCFVVPPAELNKSEHL